MTTIKPPFWWLFFYLTDGLVLKWCY
jgi:hypothetical protein